jgi:DNA polymerase III sliding clamp (beta) subunit (PCNA family)
MHDDTVDLDDTVDTRSDAPIHDTAGQDEEATTDGPLQLSCDVGDLLAALSVAQRATVANPPLVAYTGVLLVAGRGRLLVTGTDGETTIAARVGTPGCAPGRVLVAPKPLAGWLATHDRLDQVALEGDGTDLVATIPGHRPYRFRGLNASFPAPRITRTSEAVAGLAGLGAAVAAVRHAADAAIRLRQAPEGLWVEATDNHRAAAVLLAGVDLGGMNAIVPLGPLAEMGRQQVTQLALDPRGRELRGSSDKVWISTRLAAVPFPEVDQLVHAVPDRSVTVDRTELNRALTRLGAVADGAPAKLAVNSSKLVIETHNGEVGDGAESLDAVGDGGGFTCAVAVRYLIEAVAAHDTENVHLRWSEPLRPLYVTSDDPGSRLTVVMPVRV